MSSPAYEIFFRTADFDDVASYLNTFADFAKDRQWWSYPREHEVEPHLLNESRPVYDENTASWITETHRKEIYFDLVIEKDDDCWDEFIEDVEIDFFDAFFEHSTPSCCLGIERRKWAGTRGYRSLAETLTKLLTNFDGLFATEQQLFTLDDLIRGLEKNPISEKTNEIVDYTAIKRTDDPLTKKRVAFGIREAMEMHYLSDPYFEIGNERIRRELTDEIIGLGEATIPVIAAWLESENNGLVNIGAEIIAKIGGIRAIDVLRKTAFESKVNSFAKHKTAKELLKLVSGDEQLEIQQWITAQFHE
jgi:hypothetical protein